MANHKNFQEDSIKIKLPGIQQKDAYACGPATLQSIMSYFGVGPEEQSEYSKALKTNKTGTKPEKIIKFARKYGLKAKMKEGMSVKDLEKELDLKHPVICAVQSWGDEEYYADRYYGHYIVAVGYDLKNIYFLDPLVEGYWGYITKKKFLSRWIDQNGIRPYDALGISIWMPYHKKHQLNKAKKIL
jgi:predicted double-glycine peptidase